MPWLNFDMHAVEPGKRTIVSITPNDQSMKLCDAIVGETVPSEPNVLDLL